MSLELKSKIYVCVKSTEIYVKDDFVCGLDLLLLAHDSLIKLAKLRDAILRHVYLKDSIPTRHQKSAL